MKEKGGETVTVANGADMMQEWISLQKTYVPKPKSKYQFDDDSIAKELKKWKKDQDEWRRTDGRLLGGCGKYPNHKYYAAQKAFLNYCKVRGVSPNNKNQYKKCESDRFQNRYKFTESAGKDRKPIYNPSRKTQNTSRARNSGDIRAQLAYKKLKEDE